MRFILFLLVTIFSFAGQPMPTIAAKISLRDFAFGIKRHFRTCGVYEDIKNMDVAVINASDLGIKYRAKIDIDEWATLTLLADENKTVKQVVLHHKDIDNMFMGKKRTIPLIRVALQGGGVLSFLEHRKKCFADMNFYNMKNGKYPDYNESIDLAKIVKYAYKSGKTAYSRLGKTCIGFKKTGIDEITTYFWRCKE